MADFIKVDRATGVKSFTVPRARDGSVDYVKVLYGIGNIFETGKFLQKYKVLDFPLCTRIATQLGSIKVFSFQGKTSTLKTFQFLRNGAINLKISLSFLLQVGWFIKQ